MGFDDYCDLFLENDDILEVDDSYKTREYWDWVDKYMSSMKEAAKIGKEVTENSNRFKETRPKTTEFVKSYILSSISNGKKLANIHIAAAKDLQLVIEALKREDLFEKFKNSGGYKEAMRNLSILLGSIEQISFATKSLLQQLK